MSCCPHKESNLFRNLNLPNTLPREGGGSCITNLMIERSCIKLPITIKIPTKPVTPSTPRDSGLDEMKKDPHSHLKIFFIIYSLCKHKAIVYDHCPNRIAIPMGNQYGLINTAKSSRLPSLSNLIKLLILTFLRWLMLLIFV